MIYSKEAYDIDIKQLMSEIENKITNKELKEKLKISGDDYLERIKIGYHQVIALRGFENEPYYIIHEQDNYFEYWLNAYKIAESKTRFTPYQKQISHVLLQFRQARNCMKVI
jgi:hypothetical protein